MEQRRDDRALSGTAAAGARGRSGGGGGGGGGGCRNLPPFRPNGAPQQPVPARRSTHARTPSSAPLLTIAANVPPPLHTHAASPVSLSYMRGLELGPLPSPPQILVPSRCSTNCPKNNFCQFELGFVSDLLGYNPELFLHVMHLLFQKKFTCTHMTFASHTHTCLTHTHT